MQLSAQQAVACGSSDSDSRSIAELVEGYLLQHADTLQAKQPAVPSRAAVVAWKAVCEHQWEDLSLPSTLKEASVVLASIPPHAAASSYSQCKADARTAAASVWAMQACRPLGGHFGVVTKGESSYSISTSTDSPITGSSCFHSCSSGSVQDLLAALGPGALIHIGSCIHQATVLSGVCLHLAENSRAGGIASSSSCSLACTLLATAAAAIRLEGAAALPLVTAAVAAATALVTYKPAAQQHAGLSSAAQQEGGTAASRSDMPGSNAHMLPHTAATTTATSAAAGTATEPGAAGQLTAASGTAAAATGAVATTPVPVGDGWLQCMSLAGDLTTAVLQLESEPALQPDPTSSSTIVRFECTKLLLELLKHQCPSSMDPTTYGTGLGTDKPTQLLQLQSVAHTLQLMGRH